MAKLTAKQNRFVEEYLIDLNATQAAIRAGYKGKNVDDTASQLLRKTLVKQAIEEAVKKRSERTEITQDKVLQELWNILTADTNEIVELRRHCCRYCWGNDNKYQFTKNEFISRKSEYETRRLEAMLKDQPIPEFDPLGGNGYDATREPNKVCPECFGEGVNQPFFKDTRTLSNKAKSLYAGVKVTTGGLEIKLNSKEKAIELLGRHLGMFKDKVEVTGKDGGPIEYAVRWEDE